jgi:hypothetical protein
MQDGGQSHEEGLRPAEATVRLVLRALLVILVLATAQGSVVVAQTLTPEATQEAQAFKLDVDVAGKILSVREEIEARQAANPPTQQERARLAKLTLDERAAELEADKHLSPILTEAGITPKAYLVGLLALRGSDAALHGLTVGLAAAGSADNVAFLKANPEIAGRLNKTSGGGSMLSTPKKR